MKSTVYIHPGLPKTGTTAIQNFLRDNAPALEQKGVAYPIFPRKFTRVSLERNGHFLSSSVEDMDFKKACFQEVLTLSKRFQKIILTDEELWHWVCGRTEFWSVLKEELAKHDIDVKMIVYLRRQDAFAASLWAQKIKSGAFRAYTFKNFIKDDLYDMHYYDYLQQIASVIGKDHVIVRPYEFSQFVGKDHSIVSDFLHALDIPYDDSMIFENKRVNSSLGGNILELKRQMNRVEAFRTNAPKTIPYFFELEKEWKRKKKYHDCSTWLKGEREDFLKNYDEGNQKIATEFMGRDDGLLFVDPLPGNDPEKRTYTYEEMYAIIKRLYKKVCKDPEAPFTPEEFKKICDETRENVRQSTFYVYKHPTLKKIERKVKGFFGIEVK